VSADRRSHCTKPRLQGWDEKSGVRKPLNFTVIYLITWCCYGSHIPGEGRIVSRRNNLVGAPTEPECRIRASAARKAMTSESFQLDPKQREIVLRAIMEGCRHRSWILLAAHVRTNHIHVVVNGEIAPERLMNALKSYASGALNLECPVDRRWARHGSTLYLWTRHEVTSAIRYVVSKQGEPMALFAR
jgi:REP element-mobilizing transposase RayT